MMNTVNSDHPWMIASTAEIAKVDCRVSWIIRRLKDGLGNLAALNRCTVEEVVMKQSVLDKLDEFFTATGPAKLFFVFQRKENILGDVDEKISSELFLTDGSDIRLRGKCFYFVRYKNQDIDRDIKNPELEIGFGEILPDTLQCLHWGLQKVFIPALDVQDWGRSDPHEVKEYLAQAAKFNEMLVDASKSMQGGIELRRLEKRFLVENKQQAYMRASQDPEILSVYESVMESWCDQCECILMENHESTDVDDSSGPDTEFEFWRNRMAKFSSVAEQLKMKEHRCVVGVVAQNRTGIPSPVYRRWRSVDNMITDCLNEAKDNVKYLSILEKYTECLYTGTPASIIEALPALISNTKMMLTIAKYYGTSERMTKLFSKITNQMIINCKNSINRPVPNGPIVRLWDQDVMDLLERLKDASRLYDAYVQQYRAAKEKLALQPKGKQFDFPENKIFDEFDQFNKRVQKLISMFTTIYQFSSLAISSIEGMEMLILTFSDIMKEFKRKPYDLLDYSKSAFNRDYLEYTVNIAELEQQVQNFINHSFENIISTEQALALLKKFETLLVRDVLRTTLESKYDVIFQNYGQDLEAIQRLYEKHKASPPTVRNVPPVMGNILWAQQLLHRVEDPMRRFKASTTSLMQNSKDAKRIIKMYNKVARALIEFETLWHNAWIKSVEAARSGLQATLIIRHPRTCRLFVNFDREILQLIGEAKGLQRTGVDIPENARMVLSHEEKLKSYFNQLSFALKEYDRVISMIIPVVRPLLKVHLDDLDMKIQPGMVHLTWQSMNIDSYLQKIHTGLSDFEGLVRKVNDIMERVDRNIKSVSKSLLIDLPSDQSFTLEQFVTLQEKVTRFTSNILESKNVEIGQAIQDVMHLISSFPLESMHHVSKSDIEDFWNHHSRIMYLAFLHCTKQSFFALKNRLKSRTSRGLFWVERPFFDVDVELALPSPTMNPSLEEIQISINRCALNILRCSKKMLLWPQVTKENRSEDSSFHFLIGQDYQIVSVCLMLTGAVESVKKQVLEYLQTFLNFDFLWKTDKDSTLCAFIASNPTLDTYDQEMLKYHAIDLTINDIPTVHNLGCLCLHTGPLKTALQREVSFWKILYSNHLRKTLKRDVASLSDFFNVLKSRLTNSVTDLDSARELLTTLREVRSLETDMATKFDPISSAYQLLSKHSIRLDPDEYQGFVSMESEWMNVIRMAQTRTHELHQKQFAMWADLKSSIGVLEHQVSRFRADFLENGPMVENILPLEAAERMRKYKSIFQEYQSTWNRYKEGIRLFGRPVKSIPDLELTAQELELLDELYSLYVNVLDSMNEFTSLPFSSYSGRMGSIESVMDTYRNRCNVMPVTLRDWRAYGDLKDMIDDFLSVCPILRLLSSRAIRQRHWRQIQELLEVRRDIDAENLLLGDVLNMDLTQVKHHIDDVCLSAAKELAIEMRLESLKNEWSDCRFEFQNFKNRGPVVLKISSLRDILEKCDLSTAELGRVIPQKHSKPFRETLQLWITRLSSVSDMIESILSVQPLWIHMECIFSNVEMVKQVPLEAKRFAWIDKAYMKYISRIFETPNVLECCNGYAEMKVSLGTFREQLELSQKSIAGFIESKRAVCPRLYFVSDKILLEIMCEEHDLTTLNFYLKYLFHSLSKVKNCKEQKQVAKILISDDLEEVLLTEQVEYQGNIEEFVLQIEEAMKLTIRSKIRECSMSVEGTTIKSLCHNYSSQVCVISLQVIWTRGVEDGIIRSKTDKKALPLFQQATDVFITDSMLLLDNEVGMPHRRCFQAMILIKLYQKGILDDIIRKKIRDLKEFDWQKQAKFYLALEMSPIGFPPPQTQKIDNRRQTLSQIFPDAIKVEDGLGETGLSMMDCKVPYCNEFIGCKERLVITPTTERCILSMCHAMQSFLACAVVGVPGTGKSCTVKEFANSLGKYLVILDCTHLMCLRDVELVMKGLAISGLWGLFDNVTNISNSLLSLFAYYMSSILTAMRERKKEFMFSDSQNLVLNSSCAFVVTFCEQSNLHLPENFKSLLRCASTTDMDLYYISQMKFSSFGFQESMSLAKSVQAFYDLCISRLAEQSCSFNVNSLLRVIRYAHVLKREYREKTEKFSLVQALRDIHSCRLTESSMQIFIAILQDVFPDVATEIYPTTHRHTNKTDVQTILDATVQLKIKFEVREQIPVFVGKALQLYQMVSSRYNFGAVGPTCSGKTLAMRILSSVQNSASRHQCTTIFPGCLTIHQLAGGLNVSTGEWDDGIFAGSLRKSMKSPDITSWILFDGPISSWIELLSSVLEDSRTYHVGNSDRVVLTPEIKIAFETDCMNHISPSIAAKIDFVYFQQDCAGYDFLVSSWLQERPQATCLKRLLQAVASGFSGPRWSKRFANSIFSELSVSQACSIKRMLDFLSVTIDTHPTSVDFSELCMKRLALFSIFWSIGGLDDEEGRKQFEIEIRKLVEIEIQPPPENTCFSYYVDEHGEWLQWLNLGETWRCPEDIALSISSIVVPTIESQQTMSIFEKLLLCEIPTILTGGSGVGKSLFASKCISGLKSHGYSVHTYNCTYATESVMLQTILESDLERRYGHSFGPLGGKKRIIFIEDLHIAQCTGSDTKEMIRQLLHEKGYYDTAKIGQWKHLIDHSFAGSATTSKGKGIYLEQLPARLSRLFYPLHILTPTCAMMDCIFGPIFRYYYSTEQMGNDIGSITNKLCDITVVVWGKLCEYAESNVNKVFSQIYTGRSLIKLCQGMMKCDRDVILNRDIMLKLWIHECKRTFGDPLITMESQQFVLDTIIQHLEDAKLLSVGASTTNAALHRPTDSNALKDSPRPIRQAAMPTRGARKGNMIDLRSAMYFCAFAKEHDAANEYEVSMAAKHQVIYELAAGLDSIKSRLFDAISRYNSDPLHAQKLNISLFPHAIEHLLKISRIITTRGGHCLLFGGVGKTVLSQLAAFMSNHRFICLDPSPLYSNDDFSNHVQEAFESLDFNLGGITCMIRPSPATNLVIWDGISSLISSMNMELPFATCYPGLNKLVSLLQRPTGPNEYTGMQNPDVEMNGNSCIDLHIIISLNREEDIFCLGERYPVLVKQCHLVYIPYWSNENMEDVARFHLELPTSHPAMKFSNDSLVSCLPAICQVAVEAQDKCVSREAIKRSDLFLNFVNSIKYIYCSQHELLQSSRNQFELSLETLQSIQDDIDFLKNEAEEYEITLNDNEQLTASLLKNISKQSLVEEKKRMDLQALHSSIKIKKTAIKRVREEIDKKVYQATPALLEAKSALQHITAKDLQALKGLKNPPTVVKVMFDVLLLLLSRPVSRIQVVEDKGQLFYKDSFAFAAGLVFESSFIEELMTFSKGRVNDESIELMQPYLQSPLFSLDMAKKVSIVSFAICLWIKAMVAYHEISKDVQPQLEALWHMESDLGSFEMKFAAGELDANMTHAEIESMQSQILHAVEEKKGIQLNMDLTERKIQSAKTLLATLDEHSIYWKEHASTLSAKLNFLAGDSIIAAVLVELCSPLDKQTREDVVQNCTSILDQRNIAYSPAFALNAFFISNHERASIISNQFKSSESMDNIIILRHSQDWPLIFDPDGQALRWILTSERENMLKRITSDKLDLNLLNESVTTGIPLVVEDISERLNPYLFWIISKLILKRGKPHILDIGNYQKLEHDPHFKLYLTTSDTVLKQSCILNGVGMKVLNFFQGQEDLHEQLLSLVLSYDSPGNATKRYSILSDLSFHENNMHLQEQEIVKILANTDGTVIGNFQIIESLAASSRSLSESKESLRRIQESSSKVFNYGDDYKKLINSGSLLYSLALDMQTIDVLYSTSFSRFLGLFKSAIDTCIANSSASSRVSSMVDDLILTTGKIIVAGLFESHHDIFWLLLNFRVQVAAGQIAKEHVDCFSSHGMSLTDSTRRKPYSWIPDFTWSICLQSSFLIPALKDLPDSVQRFGDQWKTWCDSDTPETGQVPDITSVKNGRLEKINLLILIRAFRIDRLRYLIRQYVFDCMGSKFTSTSIGMLEMAFASSAAKIPLLCFYVTGSETNRVILQLAKKFRKPVRFAAMGNKQDSVIRRQVELSISLGSWIVIENAHINSEFLLDVENNLNNGPLETDFRLWLTMPVNVKIPLRLIQSSVRICLHPPTGIKECLEYCDSCFGSDFEESTSWQFKSLALILCIFHNSIQARTKYGKFGWCQLCDIGRSDFISSAQILQGIRDDVQKKVKDSHFEKLRYILGDVFYGSKMTDYLDKRILSAYADHLFEPSILEPNNLIFNLKHLSLSDVCESGQSFKQVLDKLSLGDKPEHIGLPAGSEIASDFQNGQYSIGILGRLISLSRNDSNNVLLSDPARFSDNENILSAIISKVPPAFGPAINLAKVVSPIDSVFKQEVELMQQLRETLMSFLQRLKTGRNLQRYEDDSTRALKDVVENRVPRCLLNLCNRSTSLSGWLDVLHLRYEQCTKWLEKGRPHTYWLGGFQRPQALLAALKQEAARSHRNTAGWAVEDILVYAEVTRFDTATDVKGPAEDGIYVHSVYLHNGAVWNKRDSKLSEMGYSALAIARGAGNSSSLLPVLYFGALPRHLLKHEDMPAFECPLYSMRVANALPICQILMKQDESKYKWNLRGLYASCHKE